MKAFLIVSLLVLGLTASAQVDSTQAAYLRFHTLPPFQLLKLDSATMLTKEDLPRNKPVLLMYFSPDCDHCQHQMDDLLKEMDAFKQIQFVMATIQPFDQMKAFYEKYQLARYPNVFVGRDTKYFLPPFYRMNNLPFMALYDKKGNLITTFSGNVKSDTLLKAFGK